MRQNIAGGLAIKIRAAVPQRFLNGA